MWWKKKKKIELSDADKQKRLDALLEMNVHNSQYASQQEWLAAEEAALKFTTEHKND